MKLREFLIGTALMFMALDTARATPPFVSMEEDANAYGSHLRNAVEASKNVPLPAVPSPLISQDKVFASAYYDTLGILGTSNACSDFFGGPIAAVHVFNRLIGMVQKDYYSSSIGMRMSGRATSLADEGTSYRLFRKVSINTNDSFYRRRYFNSEPSIGPIGNFEPNTKEIRVLILLHELGHMIKGTNGSWLLPDDGEDEELSRINSRKIEDVCGDQIKVLGKAEARIHESAHSKPEKVAQAGTNP